MPSLTQPRRRSIGGLGAIEFPAADDAPIVVVFHGYGADASDLAPLAMELDLPGPARWVFPDGLLELGFGGRAWFPIDERRLQAAQVRGRPIDLSALRPSGLDEALSAAQGFLKELGAPAERLFLGGFSQGAMLSLELALRADAAPGGLFLLSGTLVDEPAVTALAPKRAGLPFFQSHGRQDPLLSFERAERLRGILESAGWKGRFVAFDGGHTLPYETVQGLGEFLGPRIPPAA